jgi:hypothetical protein
VQFPTQFHHEWGAPELPRAVPVKWENNTDPQGFEHVSRPIIRSRSNSE